MAVEATVAVAVEDSTGREIERVPMTGDSLLIGRSAECGVRLTSSFVSREHAELRADGEQVKVKALGSNGIYLNSHLLNRREEHVVEVGDVLSLPGFTLRLMPGAGESLFHRSVERMRAFSEVKAELHRKLLERVDLRALTAEEVPDEERRRRLHVVLDELLDQELDVGDDLGTFVVAEAFRNAALDRLFARADGGSSLRRDATTLWERTPQDQAFERVLETLVDQLGVERPGLTLQEKVARVNQRFEEELEAQQASVTPELRRHLIRRTVRRDLEALVFGFGPLEDLLRMPHLNEVMVIGRDRIFVESPDGVEETGRSFPSDEDLEVVIGRIVAPVGRFVNRSEPIVDARLEDGSRVNIVIPPVSIDGPAITIRKFRESPFSIEDLVRLGTLDWRVVRFLRACVIARKNLIISGGTGSGKTTLLNTLSSQIPPDERIVVIEDSAELQLQQPNLVRLEAKKANVEGEGEITIRDLVHTSLRMRPDRILVGECRGGEALDMLQAMNTGHDGSLTTAHANNPRELLSRLEVMVLEASSGLPVAAIQRQIAGALDVIVQIQRRRDRSRKVTHVSQVVGYDSEEQQVVLEDVFRLIEGETPELRFTGYLPTFIDQLLARGDTRLESLLVDEDEEPGSAGASFGDSGARSAGASRGAAP